jgi:predicted ArsR family transcriptional regulator
VALKQRGPGTIAQLAESLSLTGEAVRQQLLQLQRDGWVDSKIERTERVKTGRPATTYRLTEAGDHLFPKHYDGFTVAMLDAIREDFGSEAVTKVLGRLTDDRVATVGPTVSGMTLDEKIAALKSWYLEDDPYMEPEAKNGSYRLTERNCPFLNTALRRPAICSISVNALTRILGYRVVREEKFQHGDGRCIFRVLYDQPIDPDAWEFQHEPEFTP